MVFGGEKWRGGVLGEGRGPFGKEVPLFVLKDTGHWVLEERPKETTDALLKFL